jgi:hypothetical protein
LVSGRALVLVDNADSPPPDALRLLGQLDSREAPLRGNPLVFVCAPRSALAKYCVEVQLPAPSTAALAEIYDRAGGAPEKRRSLVEACRGNVTALLNAVAMGGDADYLPDAPVTKHSITQLVLELRWREPKLDRVESLFEGRGNFILESLVHNVRDNRTDLHHMVEFFDAVSSIDVQRSVEVKHAAMFERMPYHAATLFGALRSLPQGRQGYVTVPRAPVCPDVLLAATLWYSSSAEAGRTPFRLSTAEMRDLIGFDVAVVFDRQYQNAHTTKQARLMNVRLDRLKFKAPASDRRPSDRRHTLTNRPTSANPRRADRRHTLSNRPLTDFFS